MARAECPVETLHEERRRARSPLGRSLHRPVCRLDGASRDGVQGFFRPEELVGCVAKLINRQESVRPRINVAERILSVGVRLLLQHIAALRIGADLHLQARRRRRAPGNAEAAEAAPGGAVALSHAVAISERGALARQKRMARRTFMIASYLDALARVKRGTARGRGHATVTSTTTILNPRCAGEPVGRSARI